MPDLATTQQRVSAALADTANNGKALPLIAGTPAHARSRLAVYRSNVNGNARRALAATYPIVCKLVGGDFFGGLAREYCRQYPSACGDLNRFGAQFADFTAAFPHTQSLPYLPDVARLEWLAHSAHYAADHAAFDTGRLASIGEDDYPRLAVELHSAVAILASPFPVFRIWEVHQEGFQGEFSVDIDAGVGDTVVVYRPHFHASVAALSGGEFSFLGAIIDGKLLGEALQLAHARDAGFDLTASLQNWIAANIVVGLSVAG